MTTETASPNNQADASTAFLRAARAGQIDKIISLLEQGVDINVSNANGLNAIHLASKDGHVEVVRELLNKGAAIDAATKKGNTALHIASLAGQEAVVKLLVQNSAQVNIQSQNGFTPLYMAAQENHDGVVKFLLSNGANQSLATEDGFTPLAVAMQQGHEKVVAVLLESDTRGRVRLPALHIAAKKDDVKAANLLLENEHNPDVTSKSGFTPLHIAAHYGNEQVARLLLNKGAEVNFPAKHNICPLHVAAKWGKENMVVLLCDNGANVEARTRDGLTPLHCAARSGHERVVELLLDRGAPITCKSKNGLAPLHMAAQGDHAEAARVLLGRRAPVDEVTVDYLTALHVAAHCGHAKVAKLLLDRNADANARALNGFTPLHIACKKNRIKVVELLLKYGASIQATTESGLTPLHVAAFMGCMNIVIYLLQHDANPDVPTVRGETPLHLAARANQTDIIRILLRNGANVDAKAREKQTPLHIASRLGNVDIAVMLLQHGADVKAYTNDHYNALHIAAKQHNYDVAAALIEHDAPLNAMTKKGFTALHLCAKYGNLKVAKLLLMQGSDENHLGETGTTPLHVAAQYDQHAVATLLLEKGADAKAVARTGHTPLHIAARKNQMEVAATLLEHGALANAESRAGFTPLHLAAQQGHAEMCALLLEHGAEVDHQARNGLAALHLAAQEDRVPVAQLLKKNGAKMDICTKGGYTPLHIASHYGQVNMVRFLLDNKASVKAKTSHGYTALHHAAQQGHINIVNILLERKADANAATESGQTPLDIASKLGYVTIMETLKGVSKPSKAPASQDKYKVVAPETMLETFMSDSEEEGGEDLILNDQPYRYLTADDMKSLGDDSLPIDVTKDERTESAMSHKNTMETSTGSMVNGIPYQPQQEVVVKSISRYSTAHAPEAYCYNVDPSIPNFLVSFLVDARGGAMRGCRGGGVRVIVPPLSAQQPTRITCRYLKPSRINHMPPLMEGEALAARVLEMGPVSAKFLGPVILEVPHYASLRGKEREIVILRSDNGTSWREHNADATEDVVQDILHETLEIEEPNDEEKGSWDAPRVIRILTHDFPQYFAVISRIRQEVHAIGPEGGMVSSSVVPQVQAVFPQGALTKKIKVGLQAQIIDSELTAKLLGRGVAVSPVVTVEPRRRKFHKAITLSMPAPRPHTQGMTNQYSTSSAPTLRLLCSISGVFRKRSLEGGTNRAHWEDVTENTPLTFVNDCVSFTTTVSARYWLIDCRHVEEATKMATELYREAIHVPFMSRFVVFAKRTDELQAQLRLFCVTDDKEDKALERIERYIQVAKSRDVEVHEGKPIYLEFAGNLVPIANSGEQLQIPFRAFRENRVAFPVMIKTQDLEPMCRCQFMRDPKVPKGEPSPTPIAVLNIMVPDEIQVERASPVPTDSLPRRTAEQELIWRQRLSDPRLEDICNLLGKDWVALAYELGVSVATVNQIQAKRISAAEQAQLMLKLWKTQSGTKAQDTCLELALCRIGRDDIIAPQSDESNERRIQRNIYQERQASEEIEAYKAEEDNKLKEKLYDDNKISERMRESEHDQDEAKYSPEEKSVYSHEDKSVYSHEEKSVEKTEIEIERTPTPSEESEEDEDVKKSVAERKEQITRKLSSSKIPASKQKKEIREEIIEIKTQIKPVKKFQDTEQKSDKEPKTERKQSKVLSPESVQEETVEAVQKEEKHQKEEVIIPIKEEPAPKPVERPVEQFRKFDPSSPAKPTPKHFQRHARNDSMKFSSGDFSNVTITPRKLVTETVEARTSETSHKIIKEVISQKEISSSKVEEKLDDVDKSPDLVEEKIDAAETTLKDKISSFETKMSKESSIELPKSTVKLTKEALKKHTMAQAQSVEYTQEFVRKQSEQLSMTVETTKKDNVVPEKQNSVKETIQHFDSKSKDDKEPAHPKAMRTDSTLVQVSSEEDNEFQKKSTDSETETESQTTVKVDKDVDDAKSKKEVKRPGAMSKFGFNFRSKSKDEKKDKSKDDKSKKDEKDDKSKKDEKSKKVEKDEKNKKDDKSKKDESKKDDDKKGKKEEVKKFGQSVAAKVQKIQKQLTEELRGKVSEEELTVEKDEKDVTVKKMEAQKSSSSTKSDISKITKTDSMASDVVGRKISQESPVEKDSLADLQTEKDFSFISQTESKTKDSKHRSDSLDEASQFSDLDDQRTSPAQKLQQEKELAATDQMVEKTVIDVATADQGMEKTVIEVSTTAHVAKKGIKHIVTTDQRSEKEVATADQVAKKSVIEKSGIKQQTLEFLKLETEHSSQVHAPVVTGKSQEKVSPKESPVISAKARQFIETVPEDDSVQECFFSKRIYSDSLEDSEQSDSRRHSEPDSLKSDQSDLVKAKVSSSDFDERAENEEAPDSGSGFGDEKFEESIGFTAIRIDPKVMEKTDSDSDEGVFKKVGKRHSRTDSMSITKLSDIQTEVDKLKQEFHIVVTEAESDRSDRTEPSDRISSESSREIEISDRKSSEGVSDRISSEDAVTDKKTSSEEEPVKVEDKSQEVKIHKAVSDLKQAEIFEQVSSQVSKQETIDKVDVSKRQSLTSAGSGSFGELRLDEKRPSDAHSLTESRDYTFEESEDDIGIQGTHVDVSKDKVEIKQGIKVGAGKPTEQSKLAKLTHGDSLDDVEGFPEDHVAEYIHKLPHISEVSGVSDRDLTNDFLSKERQEQVKRETIHFAPSTTIIPDSKELADSYTPVINSKETETTCSIIKKDGQKAATEGHSHTTMKETTISKFDVSKIRTDTLGKFEISDLEEAKDSKKFVPKDLDLHEAPEITKEQIKPVIDEIIQKGVVAAAKSPVLDKDIRKDVIETEKRSYDAKAPHVEERRHSCISPAISLERIAESDVEDEEDDQFPKTIPESPKVVETETTIKKSDSAMKQMADNIEIIIKQASEEIDLSSDEHFEPEAKDISGQVSVDSIIEEAVVTVEEYLDSAKDSKAHEISSTKEILEETQKFAKDRPNLMKSLSRDSGELVIMPKKKQPRTFSVQSSPEEVEEQIYTDSESDMDKAKVLEIIEPASDTDGKAATSALDQKKLRTDSLDDADDFPDKEVEYFGDEPLDESKSQEKSLPYETEASSSISQAFIGEGPSFDKMTKKTHFEALQSDIVSKSTTESSVTTVVSTLTKSSDEKSSDQKSVVEDGTSADLSKLSGAELAKDTSKTSMDQIDDHGPNGTPDLSRKSIDLTKDFSRSSMDSKDTSRDFATNELSKDSTVDLSRDYSKASIESVRETRSIDEKTISEDHSSFDISKTLASEISEGITASKDFLEQERAVSKIAVTSSSTKETSVVIETKQAEISKVDTGISKVEDGISKVDTGISKVVTGISKVETGISKVEKVTSFELKEDSISKTSEKYLETKTVEKDEVSKVFEDKIIDEEAPDMSELNRRCSNLLEDISQGALIRIDSSHVTHDFVSKFSKTPPPSPVDLIHQKDKAKTEAISGDKPTGLQLKGSEASFLDANRQSPRASSAGDSLISETEAHQSDVLTETSQALSAAARPKSPTKHLADNLSFINVDQPTITSGTITSGTITSETITSGTITSGTITSGAKELVDRTIEKSINVIDQIKKEQILAQEEELQKSVDLQKSTELLKLEELQKLVTAESAKDIQKLVTAESAKDLQKSVTAETVKDLQKSVTAETVRDLQKSVTSETVKDPQKSVTAETVEDLQKSVTAETFYSESNYESSTSSSSSHRVEGPEMKFQSIDPRAMMSDMIAKYGTVSADESDIVFSHKETETKKISGQEYFSEKHVSSSDDDSMVVKTETTHEVRGQEHESKEKSLVLKDGDKTETSEKKLDKAHEAVALRSDVETKTKFKTTDDTDVVKVEREFSEQGLYSGRQTKSEEKMTALKDDTIKKKQEVKISERDMATEQWGKEYFTQPGELEDIKEDEDSKSKIAFVDSTMKIREKDEVVSSFEVSKKGEVVTSKTEHRHEESVTESKDHDDLSSDASHAPSFKSETADGRGSTQTSPKSKSKSFKKEGEAFEVDFIKEIKVTTSPVKSTFSRTGSQDTYSESELAPDLPHDEKTGDTPKKEKLTKSPIKLPQQQVEDQVWEVSLQQVDSFEMADDIPKLTRLKSSTETSSITKSSDSDTVLEVTEVKVEASSKALKTDLSPTTLEISDDMSTASRDIMIKSGGSVDTECMVKSLESHEGEILQKSIDSTTVSAETLHPSEFQSEFSTEADSAFLTGTDHRKDGMKLVKEKSLEDICSSGYDTDLSSAEFQGTKLESERVDFDSIMSAQPLTDLSVLEKTIDEVKQSLEAAQVEIISEKSDGSSKYKQSPSEFQFKMLVSPDMPEAITEESHDEQVTKSNKVDQIIEKKTNEVSEARLTDSRLSDVSHKFSSQDETVTSDEDKDTVHMLKESSPPLDPDLSIRSDSGPHSILETESEVILSDKDSSSKDSPEVKLRAHQHIKTRLGVADRRSASEVEGWSSSGSSHYQSFEQSESRPLSSDIEVMMTAQSGTEFDTALTSHDVSSQSLRTSKDYYTASSLASRDSVKSLDSDGSSHVASIDISDASETLVPSANELKEELMESSTYIEQFLHETGKDLQMKTKEIEDDDVSGDDENKEVLEPLGKMKRSHEMRFLPKDLIPEHLPVEASESIELLLQEGSDTTISSKLRSDEVLSSSISKLDMSSSICQPDLDKDEVKEQMIKVSSHESHALPFAVTKIEKQTREFVDVESEIIEVGTSQYDQITKTVSVTTESRKQSHEDTPITKTTTHFAEAAPKAEKVEVTEEGVRKIVKEVEVTPFLITEKPVSQREFVDIESEIIPKGSDQYEDILKSKSDSSVPKTSVEKSESKTPDSTLDSKPSSTSSLKTQEHISTPHTPLSAPSQSSLSTDNGREYVLDDMYDISETPELKSELYTESTRSELVVTTEERFLHEKEQDSPTSDEFEVVDKPDEMDDFVVIEEVAREAQETDTEGKSVQIKAQKYIPRHDTEVEEMLSKQAVSKKQESVSSTSGSLSDEELLQYELEQKKLQAQELAEIEAGKRWIQMQFEGDPRYDYERVPLEDIKEEEMTDFDASRIGSLSSQKESIGSFGSFRNSYGSLSESEMASRIRFRVKGDNDDVSISSLQEFENLEKLLMEQYQQNSSSSQDSLNGSLPRRYVLSKSQGDDISISSLKEFEGLESACLEALKAEILAKQKEALLQADLKAVSGNFLEQEKRAYGGTGSSPPQKGTTQPQKGGSPNQKSGSPSQKNGSPSQKSGSPSQKSGSPSQRVGSYGSPAQKLLADSAEIRKLIDQNIMLDQYQERVAPKIVTVKKFDDRGAFFVPVPEPETSETTREKTQPIVISEECQKTAFVCASAPKDGSAESIPGDCEEMMKMMEQESTSRQVMSRDGEIENVKITTVTQQRFVDGKKVFETVTETEGVDIPMRPKQFEEGLISYGSMSSSVASQPSELDSLTTVVERRTSEGEVMVTKRTPITSMSSSERPISDEFDLSRESSIARELSPSSGKSMGHSVMSASGKHFTDPASGSWSGQDEELSSSGSFSRGARADLMLGSTDSLEATSSNATRATYNYEVDTPMTGSLTSGAVRVAGSNTMVSSLDTLDPVTTVHMEGHHQSTSEHYSHDYEIHEPDSDTVRLDSDGRVPQTKERTIMFDSTDTLSAVSGDGSVKEAMVEHAAATFFIGDTPIVRGNKEEEEEPQHQLAGSCPASLPPATQPSPPIPAQRRSLTMIAKSPPSSLDEATKK